MWPSNVTMSRITSSSSDRPTSLEATEPLRPARVVPYSVYWWHSKWLAGCLNYIILSNVSIHVPSQQWNIRLYTEFMYASNLGLWYIGLMNTFILLSCYSFYYLIFLLQSYLPFTLNFLLSFTTYLYRLAFFPFVLSPLRTPSQTGEDTICIPFLDKYSMKSNTFILSSLL